MNTIQPVHPGLLADINRAVKAGKRKGYPTSSAVAILNALALVQITHASEGVGWGASLGDLRAMTDFSDTTLRKGINHWMKMGVVRESTGSILRAFLIVLPE